MASTSHGSLRTSFPTLPLSHAGTQSLLTSAVQAAVMALLSTMAQAQQPSTDSTLSTKVLPQVEVREDAEPERHIPGARTTISGAQLEQANNMADIVRYQPLVSAPGAVSGGSRNRSSFDRAGTTGYNIRGIEGNRIGMDIDGVELPDATTRPYVSRGGSNTFGVGRDFIDPEMFSGVDILSGTTTAKRSAGGIGGAVGFRTKSPEDYLRGDKTSYFGGKLGHDSADRSWNESITAAGKSGDLSGLLAYSRRDGHATRNHSDTVDSYPSDWNSNALLLKGGLRIDAANQLTLSADLYRRSSDTSYLSWDQAGTLLSDRSSQSSDTSRNTLQLAHLWTPSDSWVDQLDTRLFFQNTDTKDVTDNTPLAGGATTHNLSQNKTHGWGFSSTGDKRIGIHKLGFGVNASTLKSERPWGVVGFMKPQPDTTTTRWGAFLQDEISLQVAGKRLAITPALRADHVTLKPRNLGEFASGALTISDVNKLYGGSRSHTIWSPSLSAVYDLSPQLSAYAQYKRSGRAPGSGEVYGSWNIDANYNTGNQYALIGNRDLKPETSNSLDIGLKGNPTPGVTFNGSVFYSEYKNFIAYTRYTRAGSPPLFTNVPGHIGTIYQAENRDTAKIYGLELSARLDHGQWAPSVQGLYSTWALGISRGKSKSRYAGDRDLPLDTVPPRKAIVGVGYDAPMKAWGLNLTGTFVAGKQAVANNRESYMNSGASITDSTLSLFRVPGYAIFDLAGYWQINKNLRLNAGIYNLGDKRYWDYASARALQPGVARDQRDMQLLTNPGRSFAASLQMVF